MSIMVYTSKRGKTIEFDDFVDDKVDDKWDYYWVEMCPHCHNKYRSILGNRCDYGAMGTCSVLGCDNRADYYVDFDVNEVTIKEK